MSSYSPPSGNAAQGNPNPQTPYTKNPVAPLLARGGRKTCLRGRGLADHRPVRARAETEGTRHVASPDERSKLESQPVFFWKVESLDGVSAGPDSRLVRVSWAP